MASPPPYQSSFLQLTGALLAAPLPRGERDGSKADDSFPLEDRDDKQNEAIIEIGKVSDVVQEKAAQHSQTPLEWFFQIILTFKYLLTGAPLAAPPPGRERDRSNADDSFPFEGRVGTEPPRLLAPLEYAPTARGSRTANTGGAAMPFLLDSGASTSAVGDPRIMQGIQFFSTDKWATLPDGSRLRIVGIGTIKMDGFSIPNVYLVDGLTMNLISVSQLDKDHGVCCCFHGGKCEIMLANGTVVGGAILQGDGLYKLYFLEVPEPEK